MHQEFSVLGMDGLQMKEASGKKKLEILLVLIIGLRLAASLSAGLLHVEKCFLTLHLAFYVLSTVADRFHSVQQFSLLRRLCKKYSRIGIHFVTNWLICKRNGIFSFRPPKERPNAIVARIISWNLHLISTIAQTKFFLCCSVPRSPLFLWRIFQPEFLCFFRLLWRRRIFKMLCKYSLAVWKIRDHKILSSYYVAR